MPTAVPLTMMTSQESEGQGAAARTKVMQEALDRQKAQKEELESQIASSSDAAASKSASQCWSCKHC